MKIVITGAKGMLAHAVIDSLKNENELICTDVDDLDITNEEKTVKFIEENKPDYIINCAAYTAVDKAEENKEIAAKVNSIGPKNLAIAAKKSDATLIHISTDYVFGGEKDIKESYTEDEPKNPVTVYGITKLDGEKNIQENCEKYYIFRTAWLYGEGNNFVRTMLKLGKDRDEISVVDDQHGSPTTTTTLCNIIESIMEKEPEYGIYHSTNEGFTTWCKFTRKIFELANISTKVNAITSKEYKEMYPQSSDRPTNSQLSKEKLHKIGINPKPWEEALAEYLKEELK